VHISSLTVAGLKANKRWKMRQSEWSSPLGK